MKTFSRLIAATSVATAALSIPTAAMAVTPAADSWSTSWVMDGSTVGPAIDITSADAATVTIAPEDGGSAFVSPGSNGNGQVVEAGQSITLPEAQATSLAPATPTLSGMHVIDVTRCDANGSCAESTLAVTAQRPIHAVSYSDRRTFYAAVTDSRSDVTVTLPDAVQMGGVVAHVQGQQIVIDSVPTPAPGESERLSFGFTASDWTGSSTGTIAFDVTSPAISTPAVETFRSTGTNDIASVADLWDGMPAPSTGLRSSVTIPRIPSGSGYAWDASNWDKARWRMFLGGWSSSDEVVTGQAYAWPDAVDTDAVGSATLSSLSAVLQGPWTRHLSIPVQRCVSLPDGSNSTCSTSTWRITIPPIKVCNLVVPAGAPDPELIDKCDHPPQPNTWDPPLANPDYGRGYAGDEITVRVLPNDDFKGKRSVHLLDAPAFAHIHLDSQTGVLTARIPADHAGEDLVAHYRLKDRGGKSTTTVHLEAMPRAVTGMPISAGTVTPTAAATSANNGHGEVLFGSGLAGLGVLTGAGLLAARRRRTAA